MNYLNGIYQYVAGDYVLQFDGKKTIGLYALSDSLMKNNLTGKTKSPLPPGKGMEERLKAIIQQYMVRMTKDRLKP